MIYLEYNLKCVSVWPYLFAKTLGRRLLDEGKLVKNNLLSKRMKWEVWKVDTTLQVSDDTSAK